MSEAPVIEEKTQDKSSRIAPLLVNPVRDYAWEGVKPENILPLSRNRKKKKFLKHYLKNNAQKVRAFQTMQMDRRSFSRWMDSDPEFVDAITEIDFMINESKLDHAENKLFNNIEAGKEKSLIYFLDNKGQERGYKKQADANVNLNLTGLFQDICSPAEKSVENETIIDANLTDNGAIEGETAHSSLVNRRESE